MTPSPALIFSAANPAAYPETCEALEEVGAALPGDAAAAFAFALDRLARGRLALDDERPLVLVTTPAWLRERGRPFVQGLAPNLARRQTNGQTNGQTGGLGRPIWERLIWVAALWALEEALKSCAVAGGLVTAERPGFVTTRRLDFAARAGEACGVVLRTGVAQDLSAARRRWRIAGLPSSTASNDATALGRTRLEALLARRRDGPPGRWDLEQDHATGHFSVVARLADQRLEALGSAQGRRSAA